MGTIRKEEIEEETNEIKTDKQQHVSNISLFKQQASSTPISSIKNEPPTSSTITTPTSSTDPDPEVETNRES